MKDKIIIYKDKIPYSFIIDLGKEQFMFKAKYNKYADKFTLSLYKNNVLICADEPIIYNIPLFNDVYVKGNFPIVTVKPQDESRQTDIVTYENFGKTVFLCLENGKE